MADPLNSRTLLFEVGKLTIEAGLVAIPTLIREHSRLSLLKITNKDAAKYGDAAEARKNSVR